MNKIYVDCSAGISGDMTVAALLDLGASLDVLLRALDSMPAEEFDIKLSRVKKSGLDCMDFDVVLDAEHDGHDHDMEYLYGHTHEQEHDHEQHTHDQNQSKGHHHHRGMAEINDILDKTQMTEGARKICDNIFGVLAKAESKAHGIPVSEVHFHEVGAIDSIVDIVSIAVCLDNLQVSEIIVPKIVEGTGTVRCQHGILPVPVPAVANIVCDYGITMEITDVKGELVTPTGAAFIAATRTSEQLPKEFKIKKIGMGAGKRDTGLSGILRILIIE